MLEVFSLLVDQPCVKDMAILTLWFNLYCAACTFIWQSQGDYGRTPNLGHCKLSFLRTFWKYFRCLPNYFRVLMLHVMSSALEEPFSLTSICQDEPVLQQKTFDKNQYIAYSHWNKYSVITKKLAGHPLLSSTKASIWVCAGLGWRCGLGLRMCWGTQMRSHEACDSS